MRMWMIDPRHMCRQHLLGEHLECHMFYESLKNNNNIIGYAKNNLFEAKSLIKRHNLLVKEMKERNYNHKTPIIKSIFSFILVFIHKIKYRKYTINIEQSEKDLFNRCKNCKQRKGE